MEEGWDPKDLSCDHNQQRDNQKLDSLIVCLEMERSQELIAIQVIEETQNTGNPSVAAQTMPLSVQEETTEVIEVMIDQDIPHPTTEVLKDNSTPRKSIISSGNKGNKYTIPTRPIIPISNSPSRRRPKKVIIEYKYCYDVINIIGDWNRRMKKRVVVSEMFVMMKNIKMNVNAFVAILKMN